VGEIFSENDKPKGGVFEESPGVWVVEGKIPLHDLNRRLGLELPEGDFSTLAGLWWSLAGAMPPQGAVFSTEEGITLEILDATPPGASSGCGSVDRRPPDLPIALSA